MTNKPTKKNQESESLQEQIIKLEKQLESFKHSNDHFLKNKLFLHYDIKEPEKVVVDCETKLPVLAEVEKKKIQKGKESDPTHLIIEGDNYHALSVLNYTHAGKIDVMYIDPPYNTGNKDFIYNDRLVDREDSFRHSKWLSFMAHRLRLAKNLLADKGVIFISIDDNEQAHLRLLCDQIFGEENFIVNFIINSAPAGTQSSKNVSIQHSYCLCYARSINNVKFVLERTEAELENRYAEQDEKGSYYSERLWKRGIGGRKEDVPTLHFPVYYNPKTKQILVDDEYKNNKSFVKIIPYHTRGVLGRWTWSRDTMKNGRDNLIVKKVAGEWKLHKKVYKESEVGKLPFSIIGAEIGRTEMGSLEVKEIFNAKVFDYPKPLNLICHFLNSVNNKSATILDFFAGSGTTGHAVLKLNSQDGGTRQFILCTNNENKIAEDVTYPRIKKVINGYGDTAGIPANLRYFQTDFVEKKGSASQLKIDLTRQCAEMLCVKENVFEAVKLKKQAKNYKFFKNDNKYLGVFFDFFTDPEFTDFIAELNKLPQEAEKAIYIFVLDGSAGIFADEFAGVANCEIKEIPQKILDIYKQLAREVARK